MEQKIAVSSLSSLLDQLRVLEGGQTLFLGAKAGALVRNQDIYGRLNTMGPGGLYEMPPLERFKKIYTILTRVYSANNALNILKQEKLLKEMRPEVPELCIAALMEQRDGRRLFDVVLSTGLHGEFEEAFKQRRMKLYEDFSIYVPKRDTADLPLPANGNKQFAYIKAFGDIHGDPIIHDRLNYEKHYKNVARFINDLRSQNMLVVGLDETWDEDIIPLLFPDDRAGEVWYVNDEAPEEGGRLDRFLDRCRAKCFFGPDGQYETFVRRLCLHLTGMVPSYDDPASNVLLGALDTLKSEVNKSQDALLRLAEDVESLQDTIESLQSDLQSLRAALPSPRKPPGNRVRKYNKPPLEEN